MYEMLGNQYFMARNYAKAAENFVTALKDAPKNKPMRRRLIICYTQTGETDKALEVFLTLIKEDADYSIDTDPVDDDCPCPELVFDIEARLPENPVKKNMMTILGILWLYCDVTRSLKYFQDALERDPENANLKSVLAILNAKINHNSNHTLTYQGGSV